MSKENMERCGTIGEVCMVVGVVIFLLALAIPILAILLFDYRKPLDLCVGIASLTLISWAIGFTLLAITAVFEPKSPS